MLNVVILISCLCAIVLFWLYGTARISVLMFSMTVAPPSLNGITLVEINFWLFLFDFTKGIPPDLHPKDYRQVFAASLF